MKTLDVSVLIMTLLLMLQAISGILFGSGLIIAADRHRVIFNSRILQPQYCQTHYFLNQATGARTPKQMCFNYDRDTIVARQAISGITGGVELLIVMSSIVMILWLVDVLPNITRFVVPIFSILVLLSVPLTICAAVFSFTPPSLYVVLSFELFTFAAKVDTILHFVILMVLLLHRIGQPYMSRLTVPDVKKAASRAHYTLLVLYTAQCLSLGIWGVSISRLSSFAMLPGSMDLVTAFFCIIAIILRAIHQRVEKHKLMILLQTIAYVLLGMSAFSTLILLSVGSATIAQNFDASAQPALYNIISWSLKGAFVLLVILPTVLVLCYLRFYIFAKQWKITRARNVELDLSAPLLEPTTDRVEFEHDIKPWIIKVEDLSFDSRISEGSYGVVFRGKYKGSRVAIKKLKIEADTEFEHEVRMLISLRHPNIVLFMGACLGNDFKFIVTEEMAMSLDKVLYKTREGGLHANLPFETKLSLLQDVARAVAFMHGKEQPICHRDLKPSNILLDKATSTAKICDFGTSRSISTNVATMTGTIGTFVYMSPEVLFNKSYTEKCDVYSFGIIMHEVFFEWRPYSGEGDSVIDALNPFLLGGMVTQGKRPYIPDMEYSERENEYLELMQKCWSQNADDRPSFDIILAFFEK